MTVSIHAAHHLERAEEFFEAFRQLPAQPRIAWPRYFLLCHAVELALKAFLLSRGVEPKELRHFDFGHKLDQLMGEAVTRRLGLDLVTANRLTSLAEAHQNHWARYPQEEYGTVHDIEAFERHAAKLLKVVSTAIRRE